MAPHQYLDDHPSNYDHFGLGNQRNLGLVILLGSEDGFPGTCLPRIVPQDHPIHVHCFSDSLAYAQETVLRFEIPV